MEKKVISIKEVLTLLDQGKSRKEINEHFNLNPKEIEALWNHPKLKNKRPAKYANNIEILDEE